MKVHIDGALTDDVHVRAEQNDSSLAAEMHGCAAAGGVDKEVGEGGMRFRQQSVIVLSLVCGPLNNSDYCFALATGQATSGSIDAGKLLSAFAYILVPRPHISEPLTWYDWHAFAEKAMPSALNTAATPASVPLPESSVAGKLCCNHRHFMRSGCAGDCRHRPSHALHTPLMQYALRRVCLHIRLQIKRR